MIPTGGPVPVGCEVPGAIRLYNPKGDIHRIQHFPTSGQYLPALKQGSVDKHGERVIKLGTNMQVSCQRY